MLSFAKEPGVTASQQFLEGAAQTMCLLGMIASNYLLEISVSFVLFVHALWTTKNH